MTRGNRIREARKTAGMTQKGLGEKLGLSFQAIAQWENDLRNPKQETLQRIADALGVSMPYLTGEPIRLDISMPDYALRMPTQEEVDRMAPAEQEYYYFRLLADTDPDKLKKIHSDTYDKLNKLGKVEAVRRDMELAERQQYTEPDPNNKPTEGG